VIENLWKLCELRSKEVPVPLLPASGLHFNACKFTYQGTGVSIVQYRDKTSETAGLIRIGKAIHEVTRKANVPLLINDRVDVALAVGAEGVHLGQEDMGTWKY